MSSGVGGDVGGRVLEGFAGPGGFSEAAGMLGLTPVKGIELNRAACATATAAGHPRLQADIRTVDPETFTGIEGWASGPPCPSYSDAGRRQGRADAGLVIDGLEAITGPFGDPAAAYQAATDPRTPLVLETLRFALGVPGLEWLVAEQVPAVDWIWQNLAAELAIIGWSSAAVLMLRADDFGLPTRRSRAVLLAARDRDLDLAGLPHRGGVAMGRHAAPHPVPPHPVSPFPRWSMAAVLGWPAGVQVNTRGARTTAGGNEFAADHPAPSLTHTARTWYRTDLGSVHGRFTAAQAGLLQGFPIDYPWRGSRTSRFQQAADAVPPVLATAALGIASGRSWRDAVRARLTALYGPCCSSGERICDGARTTVSGQGDLFEQFAAA